MNNIQEIQLAGICYESLVNGDGIRRVFFSQGCNHNCPGCFNPSTHSFTGGKYFNIDELVKDVINNPILKGVTFSGGDPFQQADKFYIFAKKLKQYKINIWSYTGYTYENLLKGTPKQQQLLHKIDVLVDGNFIEKLKDPELLYRGSSNQRIINVQESLKENKVILKYS